MGNKIFIDSEIKEQSTYFGWKNKGDCLYGLKEKYKNSADELVNIHYNAVIKGYKCFCKIAECGHD